MANQTVAAHLDKASLARFSAFGANGKPQSVAGDCDRPEGIPRLLSECQAGLGFPSMASQTSRSGPSRPRIVGRSLLRAYEGILESRREKGTAFGGSNGPLDTEEAIEAEAVRLCRT